MTNREQLIQDGVTDAYAEYAGVPWSDASKHKFPDLVGAISRTLPSRWNSLNAARLRTCARAYALAEMESEPLLYPKGVLV